MNDIDDLDALEFDTSEGEEPSEWEKRFENQINTFFDEAIERVPGFVDRHLTSFKRIMGRSVSPKTGLGDIVVGVRNLVSNVSSSLGGPDFSRETYTDEELTRAFEREVVSPEELEGLIRRLFREFERDQWDKIESSNDSEQLRNLLHHRLTQFGDLDEEDLKDYNPGTTREHMETVMEREIAHDPLLAQVIRSGVKIGLPATLGYVLFGKVSYAGNFGSQAASQLYRRRLDLYNRALLRLGQYQVPGWVGAVGWAGGLVGTLAIGGLMEFAVNSIRDVKGSYIRQLNAARYVLLYGENPETPEGQGIIHLVRGLERQFDQLPELSDDILDELEDLDRIAANADGDELQPPEDILEPGSDVSKEADASNPPPSASTDTSLHTRSPSSDGREHASDSSSSDTGSSNASETAPDASTSEINPASEHDSDGASKLEDDDTVEASGEETSPSADGGTSELEGEDSASDPSDATSGDEADETASDASDLPGEEDETTSEHAHDRETERDELDDHGATSANA